MTNVLTMYYINARKLKIETGRFSSKSHYVPPENRICEKCSLFKTKNEVHFLIERPLYEVHRKQMFDIIKNVNSQFEGYTKNFHG